MNTIVYDIRDVFTQNSHSFVRKSRENNVFNVIHTKMCIVRLYEIIEENI